MKAFVSTPWTSAEINSAICMECTPSILITNQIIYFSIVHYSSAPSANVLILLQHKGCSSHHITPFKTCSAWKQYQLHEHRKCSIESHFRDAVVTLRQYWLRVISFLSFFLRDGVWSQCGFMKVSMLVSYETMRERS